MHRHCGSQLDASLSLNMESIPNETRLRNPMKKRLFVSELNQAVRHRLRNRAHLLSSPMEITALWPNACIYCILMTFTTSSRVRAPIRAAAPRDSCLCSSPCVGKASLSARTMVTSCGTEVRRRRCYFSAATPSIHHLCRPSLKVTNKS